MALMDLLKKKNLADQETVTTSAPVLNQPPAEQKPKNKRKRETPQNESRRTRNSQVKIRLTVDEVDRLQRVEIHRKKHPRISRVLLRWL